MCVYFIQENVGPIKIGYVRDLGMLNARLQGLQTGNPEILHCIGVMNGTQKDERALHLQFSEHHIRGEWFHPDQTLLDYIAQHASTRLLGDEVVDAPADPVQTIHALTIHALTNEGLFPLGEKALHDCDDIIVLNEIRNRFWLAKGASLMGYASWREFVERNSRYSIRTVQRRLVDATGQKDENKINDRYKDGRMSLGLAIEISRTATRAATPLPFPWAADATEESTPTPRWRRQSKKSSYHCRLSLRDRCDRPYGDRLASRLSSRRLARLAFM